MAKKICEGYKEKKGKCQNEAVRPKVSPYCSNCAGMSFEDEIARLFRIQGYEVYQNLTLSGTQNDVFAKLKYGFVVIGVLVECKWKSDCEGKVDSEDVRKLAGTLQIFNEDGAYGKADKAYLVTNGKFVPQAFEMAKKLGIELLTELELIKNLMNFEPYLKSLIRNYEESHLNGHYIELSTSENESLEEVVNYLLFEQEEKAIVVLGDYGSGKTSFCTKVCYELAKKVINGIEVPIPIFIKLRNYSKALDMEHLITNMLVNKFNITNGNFNTFLELVEYGHVLLIFDGFDEIARKVDYSVKLKVFNEICRFANHNSKILVTCRRNFFNQRNEFERIFKSSPLHFEPNISNVEFTEVEIGDLNRNQINYYISSYEKYLKDMNINTRDFFNIIENTHDLWDLAKRPVLLNIIMETLPKIRVNHGMKINTAKLYEQYTSFWIKREEEKGKTLINSHSKMIFIKQLAKEMFINNELSIHFTKLPQAIIKHFNLSDISEIDYFSHDIKSCSFLNSEGDGYFKFIHKSFMEYFVALEILSEIENIKEKNKVEKINSLNRLLGNSLVTLEIGLFINDIFELGQYSENTILSIYTTIDFDQLSAIAKKNMISILSKTKNNIVKVISNVKDLQGLDLSFAKIKDITIRNINFNGSTMYGVNFSNVKFIHCTFCGAVFRKSSLQNVNFKYLNMELSDFSHSIIDNCNFIGTNLAYCNFNNTQFRCCDFMDAELTETKLNDKTMFLDCDNLNDTIGTPYSLKI